MEMAKIKSKSNSKKIPRYPERSADVPVNSKMLHSVRDELKSDISSLRHEMNARFKALDSRFESIDSRFESIDSRFEAMMSKMHQMHLLAEEQASRNRIVLDGLTSLFARQERGEKRIDALEETLATLKISRPTNG